MPLLLYIYIFTQLPRVCKMNSYMELLIFEIDEFLPCVSTPQGERLIPVRPTPISEKG